MLGSDLTFKCHVKSTKQSQSQLETKRAVKLSLSGRARLHSELQWDGRTAVTAGCNQAGILRFSPRSGVAQPKIFNFFAAISLAFLTAEDLCQFFGCFHPISREFLVVFSKE